MAQRASSPSPIPQTAHPSSSRCESGRATGGWRSYERCACGRDRTLRAAAAAAGTPPCTGLRTPCLAAGTSTGRRCAPSPLRFQRSLRAAVRDECIKSPPARKERTRESALGERRRPIDSRWRNKAHQAGRAAVLGQNHQSHQVAPRGGQEN